MDLLSLQQCESKERYFFHSTYLKSRNTEGKILKTNKQKSKISCPNLSLWAKKHPATLVCNIHEQARILSPIYPFHQWFDQLNAYSINICSVLRFGCPTFQSANEDKDVNCWGKNEVRGVIYSSYKVSSSRDFRFGDNFKTKTVLNSLHKPVYLPN